MPIDIVFYNFETNELETRTSRQAPKGTYTFTDLDGVAHDVHRSAVGSRVEWILDTEPGGMMHFDRLRDAKDYITHNHTKHICP